MQNKPAYAIGSVDNALRAALLLQQEGPLRLTEIAQRLGVSRSTAHRLLAMLVYRGFAEQHGDRNYYAGPALRVLDSAAAPQAALRAAAVPHMHTLVQQTGETVNLMVLAGARVRFAATVESAQVLRVGNREGRLLPAWLTSGGKVMLAALDESDVVARLQADENAHGVDVSALLRELGTVRRRGFAVNDQATEPGVYAVGYLIRTEECTGAISVAMPASRFSPKGLPQLVEALRHAANAIKRDLER